jgi:hypothetical protein
LRVEGCHFRTLESVLKDVTDASKTLTEADFQFWYEVWKIHWAKSVASEGFYFEGDNIDLDK